MIQDIDQLVPVTFPTLFKKLFSDPKNEIFLVELIHLATHLEKDFLSGHIVINDSGRFNQYFKRGFDIVVQIDEQVLTVEMDYEYYKKAMPEEILDSLKNDNFIHSRPLHDWDEKILEIHVDCYSRFKTPRELSRCKIATQDYYEVENEHLDVYYIDVSCVDDICADKDIATWSKLEQMCMIMHSTSNEKATMIANSNPIMEKLVEKMQELAKDQELKELYNSEKERLKKKKIIEIEELEKDLKDSLK